MSDPVKFTKKQPTERGFYWNVSAGDIKNVFMVLVVEDLEDGLSAYFHGVAEPISLNSPELEGDLWSDLIETPIMCVSKTDIKEV